MGVLGEIEFREGDPISKRGFALFLRRVKKAIETLDVLGGHVDWNHGSPTIVAPSGAGLPSGGEKYQVLQIVDDDPRAVDWDWVRAADIPEEEE